ncbi:hypothetical protein BD779DRAFT_246171 [Infundibulicybe gibba]|nr:hypothetical protein BD779DRAFT_246171 [Infundibulicybe gibba]
MFSVATLHISVPYCPPLFLFWSTVPQVMNMFCQWLARCIVTSLDLYTNQWDIALKGSMNAVITWIVGGLAIYRCYIIWNNTFIVGESVLPNSASRNPSRPYATDAVNTKKPSSTS